MIKAKLLEVAGFKPALHAMRNPRETWGNSDTLFINSDFCETDEELKLAMACNGVAPIIRKNDMERASSLSKLGPVHGKHNRFLVAYLDVTAPWYWWKEYDTYKVGTVADSVSSMYCIMKHELSLSDFSHEHLLRSNDNFYKEWDIRNPLEDLNLPNWGPLDILESYIIPTLNAIREKYITIKNGPDFEGKDIVLKTLWWQLIQLIPESYMQTRTIMLSYQVLYAINKYRHNHKLDEWRDFVKFIKEELPYAEEFICCCVNYDRE